MEKSGAVRFSEIAHLVKISRDTDLRKKIEQDYKKYVWEDNNQNKVSKPSKNQMFYRETLLRIMI